MSLAQTIQKNIRQEGSVVKGLERTARETGKTYYQVHNYYYQHVRPGKCDCPKVPAHILNSSFWTRADYMARMFEQGECLDSIARAFGIQADTIKRYIRMASTFPEQHRHPEVPYDVYRRLVTSDRPVEALQVVLRIIELSGRRGAREAVRQGVDVGFLSRYLQRLAPGDPEEVKKLTEERDFYYRRAKALEKLNRRYLQVLERLLNERKSREESLKTFQQELGLGALHDPVFDEYSPGLVAFKRKCETIHDLIDFYSYLQLLQRILTRKAQREKELRKRAS